MRTIGRKLLSFVLAVLLLLTTQLVSVFAAEPVEIQINDDISFYTDVVMVIDKVTYVSARMVFPITESDAYWLTLEDNLGYVSAPNFKILVEGEDKDYNKGVTFQLPHLTNPGDYSFAEGCQFFTYDLVIMDDGELVINNDTVERYRIGGDGADFPHAPALVHVANGNYRVMLSTDIVEFITGFLFDWIGHASILRLMPENNAE